MDELSMTQRANRAATIGQCKSQLHDGKSLKIRVLSGSMAPAIMPNDLMKVVKCNHKKLAPGDLVLAISGDELMPRRVISKEKTEDNQDNYVFTLKGDALKETDPPSSNKSILGKIIQLERNGRTIVFKKDNTFENQVGGLLQKLCFWKKE
ncbi:MAG: S24/S26 family peptidase [bacterium]